MPRIGLALHDEFAELAVMLRLYPYPRDIAVVEAAFEARAGPQHDPSRIGSFDREEQPARFMRGDGFVWPPA